MPTSTREGRFLRLQFRWAETGRPRVADLIFEFVRGFVRRVEYTSGHGYQRFWQATATDEPLAYHRPEERPIAALNDEQVVTVRLRRTLWGDEVYERALGFDEELRSLEKVYLGVARGAAFEAGFHPLALADEHGINAPQHRARTAVATAMTALAREHVGLLPPPVTPSAG